MGERNQEKHLAWLNTTISQMGTLEEKDMLNLRARSHSSRHP